MSWKLKRTRTLIVSAVSLAVAFVTTASADIINVPDDFPTIQEAIDAAVDGDEVVVQPGTYRELINYLTKSITVRSSDGPEVTIINGDLDEDGIGNDTVVRCSNNEAVLTVLDGFTITGGLNNVGGGMIIGDSSPTVTNCIFSSNTATGRFDGGGAMIIPDGSNPTVTNCRFESNIAFHRGGALVIGGNPTIIGCVFIGNSADFGGAIYNGGDPIFINCLIRGNEALIGGAMHNPAGLKFPVLANCTVVENVASVGGGISNDDFTLLTISNSIVRLNQPNQVVDDLWAATTVHYSNVQDGWPGIGNIDVDPLFVDPNGDDDRLLAGSPCIDAGNNWGVPIDSLDHDEDGLLCELFPIDLDGNPRFNADESDLDPGCGVPVVVDMGAYEYQFDPVKQVTFADLNVDDSVSAADLLMLLASWGPCGKGCCLADLDINGTVGASDLLILLANWGPCP